MQNKKKYVLFVVMCSSLLAPSVSTARSSQAAKIAAALAAAAAKSAGNAIGSALSTSAVAPSTTTQTAISQPSQVAQTSLSAITTQPAVSQPSQTLQTPLPSATTQPTISQSPQVSQALLPSATTQPEVNQPSQMAQTSLSPAATQPAFSQPSQAAQALLSAVAAQQAISQPSQPAQATLPSIMPQQSVIKETPLPFVQQPSGQSNTAFGMPSLKEITPSSSTCPGIASWCKAAPCLKGRFEGSKFVNAQGMCVDTPQNTFFYKDRFYDCTPDGNMSWNRYRNTSRDWNSGQCCEQNTNFSGVVFKEKCWVPKEVKIKLF